MKKDNSYLKNLKLIKKMRIFKEEELGSHAYLIRKIPGMNSRGRPGLYAQLFFKARCVPYYFLFYFNRCNVFIF
jgi:hypothetical protein